MLDPDAFYRVLHHNYSAENLLWVPKEHGRKLIDDFLPYHDREQAHTSYWSCDIAARAKFGNIWLYDQEPLFDHICDRIRARFLDFTLPDLHYILQDLSFEQLAAIHLPSSTYPIWCTSELNSDEIAAMSSVYFVPCYYWYHALIAMDWFRHYNHMRSLQPMSKSSASYRFLLYCRDDTGTRAYRRQAKNRLLPLKDMILHDWAGTGIISADHSSRISASDAGSAAVHLVFETLFETQKIYLTEKIFKPMVMSQPFIVWGPPGTLGTLRTYGFRTFASVWSEAYDLETDPDRRQHLLLDLVQSLAAMSPDQFHAIYEKCLPIIQHNRTWFYSSGFVDRCWSELEQNFNKAFSMRQHLLLAEPKGQFYRVVKDHPDLARIPSRQAIIQQLNW